MLGYTPDSFWDQTPRTLAIAFDADTELQILHHNERAWQAWTTAALGREKRMSPLRKLQVTKDQFRKKNMDEQIAGLVEYVKATGGKVIYKDG